MKRHRGSSSSALVVAGLGVVVPAALASAHPLGNLTVNTSADIVVAHRPGHDRRRARPGRAADRPGPPAHRRRRRRRPSPPPRPTPTGASECATLRDGLTLTLGGQPVGADGRRARRSPSRPGQAGLDTLRLEPAGSRPRIASSGTTALTFADHNLTDRIGWREVVLERRRRHAVASADVPTTLGQRLPHRLPDRRARTAAGAAPPRPRASPGGPASTQPRRGRRPGPPRPSQPQARGTDGLTQTLVGHRRRPPARRGRRRAARSASPCCSGALHSLAPGHGKTLMAAAVVGRRGTGRQVLAHRRHRRRHPHRRACCCSARCSGCTQALAPDRLLPWLSAASGILLAVAGATLLVRRLRGPRRPPPPAPLRHGRAHARTTGTPTTAHPPRAPRTTPRPRSRRTTTTHHDHDHARHDHGHHGRAGRGAQPALARSRWAWPAGSCPRRRPSSCCSAPPPSAGPGSASCSSASTASAWPSPCSGPGCCWSGSSRGSSGASSSGPWWSTVLRVAPVLTAAVLVGSGVTIAAARAGHGLADAAAAARARESPHGRAAHQGLHRPRHRRARRRRLPRLLPGHARLHARRRRRRCPAAPTCGG